MAKAKFLYHTVVNLSGNLYGRLKVLGYSPSVKHQFSRWVVLCKCGQKFTTYGASLVSGKTKSCGCLQKEKAKTNGYSKHSLYKIWTAINYRCNNLNCKDYKNYGGRGIKNKFSSFEEFCQSMGERPDGFTIERLNVNGDYCPGNCIWLKNEKQASNRRCNIAEDTKNKVIELSKTVKNKSEIARIAGIGRTSVDRILKNCVY